MKPLYVCESVSFGSTSVMAQQLEQMGRLFSSVCTASIAIRGNLFAGVLGLRNLHDDSTFHITDT